VSRSTKNKLAKLILDDADKKGNNINVFMSSFASEAKVRGNMLLLVDMPSDIPGTLAEQINSRAVPYLVPIEPERLVKYKLDKFGKFEWVMYSDTMDNSTPDEQDVKEVTRYYDDTKWIVYDGDDIIEQGEHGLGVCPVLQFSEYGVFPSTGEFTQIGELAKRHYNLNSELDEILRAQTFSLLTINAKTPKDVELSLGTDNAISYGEGMNKPEFIAPPAAPAQIYQERIEAIEKRIDTIAYDTTSSGSQESGISLEIKFQGLNGSLSNFAMRLQDIEVRAIDVAFRYLCLTNDYSVSYPQEFNIVDVEKEITTLDGIKTLGYELPTYEKEKLKRIIQNDLGAVDDDTLVEIDAEIEELMKEVDEA